MCDARALALAVVEKCVITDGDGLYEGERNMPWKIEPVCNICIVQ